MSHGDEFLQEERLRVRLVALRRGLARLSPTTQSEYGTWITEAEGQLHRNVQGPVLVRRLLEEIEALSKCVEFELDGWQNDAGPEGLDERQPVQENRRLDSPAALDSRRCHHNRRSPHDAGASAYRG